MCGTRINRDRSGSGHAGAREQREDAGLAVQPVLGVLHEGRVDEAAQRQVAGASVPCADGQPPDLGGDPAVQRLDVDDPFAGLQVAARPGQGQWPDGRRLIVVDHRATPPPSSGRRHTQRAFVGGDGNAALLLFSPK